jgi:ABC-type branched-subunit amino acid transport system substrate-binding protein
MIKALGADLLEGFYGTVAAADPADPNAKKFEEEFKKVYGEIPPIPYIDTSYDAVAALGLAVAKAVAEGVRDITGTVVRDNLRPVSNPPGAAVGVAGFVAALNALKGKQDINYEGAGSAMDFDAAGDVVSPIEIWQYNKAAEGGIKTITLVKNIPGE